jgi:hypothetical protein
MACAVEVNGMRQSALRFLLAMALALVSGGVCAQEPAAIASERDASARQHFAHGREAYDRGDFQTALESFQGAYGISQHPKLLYNVGLASQKLGLVTDAIAAYESYLAWGQGDRAEEVRGRVAALRDLAERDAAFAAQPAPAPSVVIAVEQPAPPPARAQPVEAPRARRRWPWAVAGAVVAAVAVAISVPLARKDEDQPSISPNTGEVFDALRWGR